MVTNLTIGGIWKNRKSNKEFELVDVNKDNNRVQIADKEGYSCMSESSLRKNYTLVGFKKEETKTEPREVNEKDTAPLTVPEAQDAKEEAIAKPEGKRATPGRIELPDGRVIPGIRFLLDVAGKTEAETCKNASVIYWLGNTDAGKALLAEFKAQIVSKPLSK